ncbi:MAG TPA: serine protease [Mucilaginibacter sp.]|nr:serine protease [Mucilaginibacter sp.]
MSDNQLLEVIERYLNGDMTAAERKEFELLRKENADVDEKVVEHQLFTNLLKQYAERVELESRLNAIHEEIDVHTLKEDLMVHPSWIVQLWRHHHSKISVAASVAIFAVLTGMFFAGYFANKEPGYEQLSNKLDRVEASTNQLNNKTNALAKQMGSKNHMRSPGNYRGSGFALSSNGYIVTNFHVVSGKFDSLYVQNADGDSYRAKLIYSAPQYDIAILKINDDSFENLPALPYNLKRSKSDVGEEVYAIGYSEGDSPVFDRGYVSSLNGYKSDSSEYRISIPVNPGNSGGPLINNKGSIIGVVSGKQTETEGASYAKKAGYLFKAIQNVPLDSLSGKLSLNNKNTLAGLSRVQQYKKMQKYVFMVKVY